MLISLVVFIILTSLSTLVASSETKLINHLLGSTTRHVRPVLNTSRPVIVTFGFELIHLLSLVEREQTLTVKVWMRMTWKNEILKWQPKKWDNIALTKLDYGNVWTPDIFLQEDIDENMSTGPQKYKTRIKVEYDGTHTWMIPVLLRSSCTVDVTNFPFDQQNCFLIFNSWTHDKTELDLRHDPRPIITSNYINSSEWEVRSVDKKIVSKLYICCPNPYVNMEYRIKLDRRAFYYIHHIVVPCIIQMIVILFTFFLPPDCGERIGVVITVLLVFAVYLQVISSSLPKASNSTPALSRFYITAMTESACSLIATCFVLAIHFKGTEKNVQPVPFWVREYFINCFGRHVCLKSFYEKKGNDELKPLNQNGKYITELDIDSKKEPPKRKRKQCTVSKYSSHSVYKLRSEVQVITTLIHDLKGQDAKTKDWQLFAKIVDCIFFYIFLITYFVSSAIILVPLYIIRQNHLH